MAHLKSLAVFALVACCLSACSSVQRTGGNDVGAPRSGGVEVFGTIDAAVTHTTTRSGR